MDKEKPGGKALVLSLCLADLRHEWLLSLCMVLAVASVLGPLLILFGLKFGTVETLRDRLIRDPRNCEIRPMSSRSYSQEWFTAMAGRADVSFVTPYTRQLATSIDMYLPGQKEKALAMDAIPTGDKDPLVLENGAAIPSLSECLLTTPAAESLGAKAGDTIVLVARRIRNGQFETGERKLTVTGVLPIRAGATKAAFIRLPLLEAIESYKDGMGVPAFGWHGELPRAYPAFSAMLIQSGEALGPELEFRVINNTGFTSREPLSPDKAASLIGVGPPSGGALHLLKTKGTPAGVTNIRSVQYMLGGKRAKLSPLVEGLTLTLDLPDKKQREALAVLPATSFAAKGEGALPDAAPWNEDFSGAPPPSHVWRHVLVPREIAAGLPTRESIARLRAGESSLAFPVTVEGSDLVPPGTVKVPLRLLGTLGLLQSRPLIFDEISSDFLLARRGYAGFRMYASSLESVSNLKRWLEEQGISVTTEAERIDDVMRLDKYLSLIFWLIAFGSLVGGAACLLSNIYAGIERKRRELAVLRLLGLSGGAFIRFPLYTAGFFAFSGFLVAMALFVCMATVINVLFGGHLQAGESLCRLALWHPPVALGLTLAVSLFAGGIAAKRSISVDPADALRND
ncbi:MAG: ABC transporter permease [Deltaproteobacteria bacterium]|jgi:putative ABC transport system permease protein|nr:ABC transporter permease [Deltaproteobacteria bacterium]